MKLLFIVAIMASIAATGQRDGAATRTVIGTGSISGVAWDSTDSNKPIRRALVTVSGAGIASRTILTDDTGRFMFDRLPSGRFYIHAEKVGYVKFFFEALRPGFPPGRAIALALGEAQVVSLPLMRGAVISGTVRGQSGEPLIGAQVRVYRSVAWDSTRRLVEASAAPYQTDERGTYRMYGFPPGEYVVAAVGGGAGGPDGGLTTVTQGLDAVFRSLNSDGKANPSTEAERLNSVPVTRGVSYYPGVTDVTSAEAIALAAGDVRGDIDIVNPLVRTAQVRGTLQVEGAAPLSVALGLVNLSRATLSTSLGGISTTAEGHFAIEGLTPGRWRLFARASGAAQRRLFGQIEFAVDGRDISSLIVPMRAGSMARGKIVVSGNAQRSLEGVRLKLDDATRVSGEQVSLPTVSSDRTGQFSFLQVPSGDYRLTVEPTAGLYVDGIVVNGVATDAMIHVDDAQDVENIEVRLTDNPTELSGRLLSDAGPAGDLCVIVFPVDPNLRVGSTLRRAGPVRLEADGSFRVRGLPAGNYYLSIVGWIEPSLLAESAVFEALAGAAVQVTLENGRQTKQNLRIK